MEIEKPQSNQPIPPNAKKVFEGVIFDVYQWEQDMYDGTKATFEKLKRPDTVVIFPILDNGDILLIEEEQPGLALSVGAPCGRIEKDEDVLQAAKRELLEETGYEAKEFILWKACHVTNKIDWVVYTFFAKGLTKVADQKLDNGERISLKPMSFDEFLKIAQGARFSGQEILVDLLKAQIDPSEKSDLRELFKPL